MHAGPSGRLPPTPLIGHHLFKYTTVELRVLSTAIPDGHIESRLRGATHTGATHTEYHFAL